MLGGSSVVIGLVGLGEEVLIGMGADVPVPVGEVGTGAAEVSVPKDEVGLGTAEAAAGVVAAGPVVGIVVAEAVVATGKAVAGPVAVEGTVEGVTSCADTLVWLDRVWL